MSARIILGLLPPLALAMLMFALPAGADDKLQSSNAEWHAMDNCTREAFHKFPDYTRDSNTKREAYRRTCLRKKGLPAPDGPPPQTQ